MNGKTGRVVGVVSQGYRLVTNQQALLWAYECCRAVFPKTQAAEWDVTGTDAPSTGGYCTIDLVHRTAALKFDDLRPGKRPDVFGPFIRVTNSYNTLRALAFDIGFYRKVCRNGLIAPDTIIQFKFSHQRRELGSGIRFEVAHDRLAQLESRLGDYLAAVRECPVPRTAFEPILRGVLHIRPPRSLQPNSKETEEWDALRGRLNELSDQYARELGETAFAVLNAITDFASRPPVNRHVHRDKHTLQRLAGVWLSEFSRECQQPQFTLARYLENLAKKSPPKRQSASAFEVQGTGSRST